MRLSCIVRFYLDTKMTSLLVIRQRKKAASDWAFVLPPPLSFVLFPGILK